MKPAILFSVCLLMFCAVATAQAQPGTFRGRVTDHFTGSGIADVRIGARTRCSRGGSIFPFDVAAIKSGADGRYELNYPDPGPMGCSPISVVAVAEKAGYVFSPPVPEGFTIAAAASFAATLPTQIERNFVGSNRPLVSATAANYRLTLGIDMLAAVFGNELAATTESATSLPLPFTLAGRSLVVQDAQGVEYPARLLFVSPTQINYLTPAGLPSPSLWAIKLLSGGQVIKIGWSYFTDTVPGLFTANADGQGVPAAVLLRQPASGPPRYEAVAQFDAQQKKFVPVPLLFGPGNEQLFLVLFGSGMRSRASLQFRGQILIGAETINLTPQYAGPQGDLAGVDQINLPLPQSLAGKGNVAIRVEVNNFQITNSVTVNFR